MVLPRPLLRLAAFGLALFAASCLPLVEGDGTDLRGQQVRLTLLHTSDIHSRLIPYDFAPLTTDQDLGLIPEAGPFGGAPRMAALLARERRTAERVLHLDSGDCFQGAPIFNLNSGEAEFRFLSEARLDAAVIGNHEFDSGAPNFTEKARQFANFPLLAANYVWDDPRSAASNETAYETAPYSLHNVQGLRVAVIGMANISSLNSIVEGGNSLQITPIEQNEAARAYVDLLRPVTDLVLIVSHLGLTEDQDLIRGYEAYYVYEKARPFLERSYHPWRLEEWLGNEGDPKAVVRVFIPGVSGIDVVLGGHLHVVLNPPQRLTDPSGRQVVLAHSGAFSKYVGRLDLVVQVPEERHTLEGAEVLSHDYRVFPLDALWCDDAVRSFYAERFWNPGEFSTHPAVVEAVRRCRSMEDAKTTELLQPYILELDQELMLTTIFAYAPNDVARRNNSSGGDSPLGNLTADSMRKRRRVEAEVAVTNTLGIRDNLYAGPITQESMFNVFPFENTINIMYLSGAEMQELFDFVADRSADRGCQAQAQISGARFTMDCAQAQLNELRYACNAALTGAANGSDCPQTNRDGRAPWQCIAESGGTGRCWAHPAIDISIQGQPLNLAGTYKIAVNDYIAKGGSGFQVLKRNTTRIETGISLRDSLIGYMQGFCDCRDIAAGRTHSDDGVPCGDVVGAQVVLDEQIVAFCASAKAFEEAMASPAGAGCTCKDALASPSACGEIAPADLGRCTELTGPRVGACTCADVLRGDEVRCGHITQQRRSFCEAPTDMALALGYEDGRIGRRVR